MSVPYTAGCVWWTLFDFKDGNGPTKKYFVLLTDCVQPGALALTAVTTSRGVQRYGAGTASGTPCGCPNAPCYRIDPGQEACFPVLTWIQFDNGGEAGCDWLDARVKAGIGGFVQVLASERIRSLLNCAKKSKDMAKRDVGRIEAVLKALQAKAKAPAKVASAPGPQAPNAPIALSAIAKPLEAIRSRVDRLCANCRSNFVALLAIPEVELATILREEQPLPAAFLGDAEAGIEMLAAECACLADVGDRGLV